jgi:hypothetical protein
LGGCREPENFWYRVFGFMMTVGVFGITCTRRLAASLGPYLL